MYIPFQPRPKVPPIGFFDPISVDVKDMMSDVEYLLGILKKLNLVIAQVNSNTSFINEYSGKIEQLEGEMLALQEELGNFETRITNDIANRFTQIQLELQGMIAATLIQANAYTDSVASGLEQEIQEISIGQIEVFDPTTGVKSPLQTVIDNLYNVSREDALTASEYDALDLSATAYDAYELTATQYDQSGKTLLV